MNKREQQILMHERLARLLAAVAVIMLVLLLSGCVTMDGFAYYGSICERPSCR